MKRKCILKHEPHHKFKGFLIENRISQKKVANLLNISPVTINQKINGNLHFTFDEVERICNEYDIKPDIFLSNQFRKSNKNN